MHCPSLKFMDKSRAVKMALAITRVVKNRDLEMRGQ